ncbi:MAG: lysophospholipid acyltransferase family protein [Bacilli bacterium]
MKNTGLKKYENATVENFTTKFGMELRKLFNPIWRNILKVAIHKKVHIEQYPKLDKDKNYIFVCNHSFDEDVISILRTLDRNAYVLNGSTDQTEHNPAFLALWANGMVYVNRKNESSRKSAVNKMNRVLKNGNSVMLFAEGGYNNSENKLILPLFNSPYIMSAENNIEVVPVIAFNEFGSDDIYLRAGDPIKLYEYEKYEAGQVLRDQMASILYEIIIKHTELKSRKKLFQEVREVVYKEAAKKGDTTYLEKLPNDLRDYYMEMRKLVYQSQEWHDDVWDEEITVYSGHGVTTPQEAFCYIDNIKVTKENAATLANAIIRREDDKHYDLVNYMSENMPKSGKRR